MPDLNTDVRYIKGIGEQRAKSLLKLNIRTLQDLISYFPRGYDDRRSFRQIRDLQPGESACVKAMVAAPPTLNRIRKGLELVKLRAVDGTGALDITFFNQVYLKDNLIPGETYIFYGKAEGVHQRRTMVNPLVWRKASPWSRGCLPAALCCRTRCRRRCGPPITCAASGTPISRSISRTMRSSWPGPGGGWSSRSCSSWPLA